MKIFLTISLLMSFCAFAKEVKADKKAEVKRGPASSIEIKRLIEIDERRGCCSHHGGVSHCSFGTLYCKDGWASGCGC